MSNALTNIKFWDTKYQTSNKSYPNPYLCRMDFEIMKQFAPFLELKRDGDLIEMGCGDSYWLPYFAKTYGFNVYGIDSSKVRAESAVNKLNLHKISGTVWVKNFEDKWREIINRFDVVYNGGVVEHFESQSILLKTFAQYLKPDGIMITTVPHLIGFWGDIGKLFNKEIDKGHSRLGMNDLIGEHKAAGLQVIYSSYFRWCDPSVINLAKLPKVLHKLFTGIIIVWDLLLNLLFHIKYPIKLPQFLYSDMVVVAKKC